MNLINIKTFKTHTFFLCISVCFLVSNRVCRISGSSKVQWRQLMRVFNSELISDQLVALFTEIFFLFSFF